MIPIKTADGSFPREIEEEELLANAGHFRIVRNRRGNIRTAILKERQLPLIHLHRTGTAFEQTLPSGRTLWALTGAPGSEAGGA